MVPMEAEDPDWNACLPAGYGNRKACCFLMGYPGQVLCPSEPQFPHPYNGDHKRTYAFGLREV